jgi:hypothetical protein
MPWTKEQLFAYMQNPEIAGKELAAKYKSALANADEAKDQFAERRASLIGQPELKPQLAAQYDSAESLASIGGVQDKAKAFLLNNEKKAQSIAEKLMEQGEKAPSNYGRVIVADSPVAKAANVVVNADQPANFISSASSKVIDQPNPLGKVKVIDEEEKLGNVFHTRADRESMLKDLAAKKFKGL